MERAKETGKLDQLYDSEIEDALSGYKHFKGVFSSLHLPNKIQKGCYVINMDINPNGSGTHWVLVINMDPKRVEYFDSYGQIPNSYTLKFMETANKLMYYNDDDYQALRADSCGYYVIYVAKSVMNGRKLNDVLKDFIEQRGYKNEKILESKFIY